MTKTLDKDRMVKNEVFKLNKNDVKNDSKIILKSTNWKKYLKSI